MESRKELIPIEDRTVDFYGDEIRGVLVTRTTKAEFYVPLRQLGDYLGICHTGQRKRINGDPVRNGGINNE
jgi:hypothetical protein